MSGHDAPESSGHVPNGKGQADLPQELAELVEQVCCGDVAVDDPRVAEARRGSPPFGRELDAMFATMQMVDDAAAMERDVLGASLGRPLAEAAKQSAMGVARSRRWWPVLAAILVAALGVALWQVGVFDPQQPRGLHFLSGAIRITLEDDGAFVFQHELPPGGWYSIEVIDEATGEVLEHVRKQHQLLFRADDVVRASWPEVVLITVRAHTRFGDETASGRVRLRK